MPPAQQRLWPDAQPLVERLGREFFRRAPATPGVYLMRGAGETVLYVGKAKNLRHRLGSYRVANPDRLPRRTLRLLNLVVRIGWEECPSEMAALRREAELLRELKPRFNRAGVWPGPKRFLAWRATPAGLELAVAESIDAGWESLGTFGAQVTQLHRVLTRLCWCQFHPQRGLAGLPAGWLGGRHGPRVSIPAQDRVALDEACDHLRALAAGEPARFLAWLRPVAASFEQPLRDEDVEFVARWKCGANQG